eukprot:15126549-Heterocapsa_arctica.AAC.1
MTALEEATAFRRAQINLSEADADRCGANSSIRRQGEMCSQSGGMRDLEAAMITSNDSVCQVETAFQHIIQELYIQECCVRDFFLCNIEKARVREVVDISRTVTEAADRNYASGGRILDYIPRDRPLSKHIYSLTVGFLRLTDQLDDITTERGHYRTYFRRYPWQATNNRDVIPPAPVNCYVDRTQ